jgi:hypothetical protein
MQAVPAHDDRGKMFRSAFTADEGHLLVSADYSQVRTPPVRVTRVSTDRVCTHMGQWQLASRFVSGAHAGPWVLVRC